MDRLPSGSYDEQLLTNDEALTESFGGLASCEAFLMSESGRILRVQPASGIPGGEIVLEAEGFDATASSECGVWFDEEPARLVGLSAKRILALIPELKKSGEIEVRVGCGEERSEPARIIVGKKIAEDLHPVSNPAFNPDDGSLFVTRSGPRGEQLPVSLFRIDASGEVLEFSGNITNPTGIAFDGHGQMFVTSRMDGTVYRITPFKDAVPFARNLGIATGIAFDEADNMYVGDRNGTIYRVNGIGEEQSWAQLEPSVSAYHMAFGPDGALYVTGPTVTSFDSIWRVNQSGDVSTFFKGLGRPQGLAFDREGSLYVAASLRGRRGIVRVSPDAQTCELVVAGMNLVGLAFSPAGDLILASIDSVYTVPLGIHGRLLG